jgi:hypothetical protein
MLVGVSNEQREEGFRGREDFQAAAECGSDVPHRRVYRTRVRHWHELLDVQWLGGARTRRTAALGAATTVGRALPSGVVSSSTTRCDVSVVNRGVHRHWGGRTSVLVDLLVQDGLQLVIAHVGLVEDDMIVSRTRGSLDGSV